MTAAALLPLVFWATALPAASAPDVSPGRDGRLVYTTDERGNRVPDFSTCGYAAQARPIPTAPVRVVVEPRSGDNTARLQRALDYVASLPPDTNGLRGAVLLLRGRHEVSGGLQITHSGVVLRGQGAGEDGTVLVATGLDRRTLIRVVGRPAPAAANQPIPVTDLYVPVGALAFHIADASGLQPNSLVRVTRPSTTNWIARLGATDLGGGVGGGWKPGSRDITWTRTVTAIEGHRITLDAPITTALDEPGAFISRIEPIGLVTNIGIEHLALESTFDPTNPRDENHSWCAITMENTQDAWVRQVTFRHFAGSAVALYETCQRITVQDCLSLSPVSEIGGYRRHTFFTMGQQTLFLRCYAEHGRHDFAVGHCAAGPNAFVQCEAREALADSGPIESWASGVLYDNVVIDGHALTLGFRPGNNAGIGWAAANCVLWNCSAAIIRCWNPPGAHNWSFGAWAGFEGNGVWRSSNEFVKPNSLFAAQVEDRLGGPAATRLQLMPRPREESSNPPLDKAQELAAASHQPAAQLKDYIAAANKRDPVRCEPADAPRLEDLLARGSPREPDQLASTRNDRPEAVRALRITNGWLTVDGKLLIGGTANVSWWRGNIRPHEAAGFGLGVTRFVPGRLGPGFTDDLPAVADWLATNGKAALDHNYGLWYDRRRDDHQRVRRMDGDVLPPFYEQPFARSGQGTAWDGLSRYDLTRFNPWYWSRLREFANLCDRRGLLLFHQHYFQHNILEAGAHWADCPWRSANNINETGFPEPPPYAGDKRIFMAELFYDVTHPVRRELHRRYIRQCLDNFTNTANVIHFTSAEFTGPLPFMEFWLDVIAEWERERALVAQTSQSAVSQVLKPGSRGTAKPADPEIAGTAGLGTCAANPVIALSATKDVQDAILADAQRRAMVDVIDFRYWWRTDQGEFAPPGGKNLAPRQFERQWRGGRPTDFDLADMAAEYRARFPDKGLICDFDAAGWAWVCAGGSLPRLPPTTDARLLAAIPRMRPWPEASPKGRWVLREPGRQYLVFGGGDLDLLNETGTFQAVGVNPRTGELTPLPSDQLASHMRQKLVEGGRRVMLPEAAVIWLKRE